MQRGLECRLIHCQISNKSAQIFLKRTVTALSSDCWNKPLETQEIKRQ